MHSPLKSNTSIKKHSVIAVFGHLTHYHPFLALADFRSLPALINLSEIPHATPQILLLLNLRKF